MADKIQSPGNAIITEIILSSLTDDDVTKTLGLTWDEFWALLENKTLITERVARGLETLFNIPATEWMAMDKAWRASDV